MGKIRFISTEWAPITVAQKYRYVLAYGNTNRKLRAHLTLGSTLYYLDFSVTLTTGVWYHVAQVFDGTNLKIYLNGELKAEGPGSPLNYANTNDNAVMGRFWSSTDIYKLSGSLDEVALYKRALTTAEIARSYNEGLGRVALWHMDGDWTDATGNGNNGTAYNGAAFSTDKRVGTQAGSLDGVDDYVSGSTADLPSGSSPADPIRLGERGKRDPKQGNTGYGTGSASSFQLSIDSSNRAVVGNDSGGITGTSSLANGVWHYVVGIYEGSGTNVARLYVDGVLENSGSITAPATESGSFSIGAFLGGGGLFNGLIDEVAIYDHALTVGEMNEVYNDGLGRIALLHMDGDWTDASGNSRNGTASGSGATFSTDARVGNNSGSFNGGYVDMGNWFNPQTFTIEMWVKAGSSQVQYADIIDNNHSLLDGS